MSHQTDENGVCWKCLALNLALNTVREFGQMPAMKVPNPAYGDALAHVERRVFEALEAEGYGTGEPINQETAH